MYEKSAPSAGPTMKPSPKAAPSMPNALGRSASEVTSAMYARAVVMLPPERPSTSRAAKSIARLCATASMTKLTTVPIRLKMSTGRRPYRSDNSPSSGDAISWPIENDANSKPMASGDAPNVSA